MLSARALAEKSADMPRRISLWPIGPAPAFSGWASSTRSAAVSKRASVKHTFRTEAGFQVALRLPPLARDGRDMENAGPTVGRYLTRAARILALRASITAASETRSNRRRMCIGSFNELRYQLRRVLSPNVGH